MKSFISPLNMGRFKVALFVLGMTQLGLLAAGCSSPGGPGAGSCAAPGGNPFEGVDTSTVNFSTYVPNPLTSLPVTRSGRVGLPYYLGTANAPQLAVLSDGSWSSEAVGASAPATSTGTDRFFAAGELFFHGWIGTGAGETTPTLHLSAEAEAGTFAAPIELALTANIDFFAAAGSYQGTAADGSEDRALVALQGYVGASNYIETVEKVGTGIWTGQAVTVPGVPAENIRIEGVGYAADGTAWMVLEASDGIWLTRRSGSAWSSAQEIVSEGATGRVTSVAVSSTREGAAAAKTLVAWTSTASATPTLQQANALTINQSSQAISNAANLGTLTTSSLFNDATVSVGWNAAGDQAIVALQVGSSKQASLAGYSDGSFGLLRAFRPSVIQGRLPQSFFDECGNAFAIDSEAATGADSGVMAVQALSATDYLSQ